MMPSQVHQQGAGTKVEQPELKLVSIWDAVAAGNSLSPCFAPPFLTVTQFLRMYHLAQDLEGDCREEGAAGRAHSGKPRLPDTCWAMGSQDPAARAVVTGRSGWQGKSMLSY